MELDVDFSDEVQFPKELKENFQNFSSAIDKLSKSVDTLTAVSLTDIHASMKPLERAKLDLAPLYAITSLYWAYLKTKGADPKSSGIPKELERIKEAMARAKQIEDKTAAPKLDVPAAKRFIKSGLSQPGKTSDSKPGTPSTESVTAPPPEKRPRK